MVTKKPFDVQSFEGIIGRLMLGGLRTTQVCLVAGLALWLFDSTGVTGSVLLDAGLIVLMSVPALRIVLTIVEAVRLKDGLFLLNTIGVAVVLCLTLTYAFLFT